MNSRRLSLLILCAATARLLAVAPRAHAISIWPSMPRYWAGYSQSAVAENPGPINDSSLVVTGQAGGLFRGVVTLPAVQGPGTGQAWGTVDVPGSGGGLPVMARAWHRARPRRLRGGERDCGSAGVRG